MLKPHSNNYDAIIAGGGPAGTSAAIHLARGGVRVVLVEQKKFPRAKLCGEFISPECQTHFEKLGVAGAMRASGPASLDETVFYSSNGHHVAVPSKWFSGGHAAYGLSRAVMDEVLLRSAQDNGVTVYEGASITEPLLEGDRVIGVRVKIHGAQRDFRAPLTIDATGRSRILSRKITPGNSKRPALVAFKAHLKKTRVATGACEIYFYPGGYGGLSTVEAGTSNLCFIIAAEHVKRCDSDPETVMRQCVMKNQRAAHTLETAEVCSDWLSASWERFGRQKPSPAPGLLAIGDSAAFIDPFTGSGMLMALESGELVARVMIRSFQQPHRHGFSTDLEADYAALYRRSFDSRLRICGWLRRAAFSPRLAEVGIAICGASERFRNRLARATRAHSKSDKFLPHNTLLE